MVRPFNPDFRYSSTLQSSTTTAAVLVMNRLPWKRPVRVATTGTITIATALNAGDVIDGVTLAEGDRVLVWQNATASQNGIITVGATPGRAVDFDSSDEIVGALVAVLEGTTHAGKLFQNTNTGTIAVDTDDITFIDYAASIATSSAASAMVPTYLGPGESFEVPDNRQALWATAIVLDVGAGISLGTNAALIGVT